MAEAMAQSENEQDYEEMEVLDLSLEEDDMSGENLLPYSSGCEFNQEPGTSAKNNDEDFWIDFCIDAYQRDFKGQKKEKILNVLHVQATSKTDFEQQVWMMYSDVLRREILYQRAEEGIDEMVMWSPTKPAWADRDRFFLFHHKRSTARLSDLTDEFLAGLKGTRVKMSAFVYSVSLTSSKDFERAKVVLGLGNRSSGLKDRAGADSNQSVLHLVNDLKQRNKNRFVKPMDASFTLWANYIQGSAAHLRDDLLAGPPPEHLRNLFNTVDDLSAQAVLDDSLEGVGVAEAVNQSIEVELKEIEDAFQHVESSVAGLRQKIDQLRTSIRGRNLLISAFKHSLKPAETEESRLFAAGIIDCPDVDHQ